jgi:hypothetical protein
MGGNEEVVVVEIGEVLETDDKSLPIPHQLIPAKRNDPTD